MFPLKDENPTQTFPIITFGLIAINAGCFVYQISQLLNNVDITPVFGMRPVVLWNSHEPVYYITLLTSLFLHGGVLHLLGNMWFLWIFGNNVEDALGHIRYLFFYLLCGIAAGLVHAYTSPGSKIPTIGASGAISGVLGAYLFLFPLSRIVTLVPIFFFLQIIRIRAIFFLGFWFLLQFIGGTASGSNTSGGVAWFAHIGGFIAGLILVIIIPKRRGFRKYRYNN